MTASDRLVPAPDLGWWLTVATAVLRRPRLWATACSVLLRTARPGWWRTPPFLPVPDATYLRFRMETQYGGDGTTVPEPRDVLTYLEWCRRNRLR